MSSKFDKAVALVQGLPKEGPVQPSQNDKLYVRAISISRTSVTDPSAAQFYAHYKQGVSCLPMIRCITIC